LEASVGRQGFNADRRLRWLDERDVHEMQRHGRKLQ
jgi:hypothetical protein